MSPSPTHSSKFSTRAPHHAHHCQRSSRTPKQKLGSFIALTLFTQMQHHIFDIINNLQHTTNLTWAKTEKEKTPLEMCINYPLPCCFLLSASLSYFHIRFPSVANLTGPHLLPQGFFSVFRECLTQCKIPMGFSKLKSFTLVDNLFL